jgi:hypothetical protein
LDSSITPKSFSVKILFRRKEYVITKCSPALIKAITQLKVTFKPTSDKPINRVPFKIKHFPRFIPDEELEVILKEAVPSMTHWFRVSPYTIKLLVTEEVLKSDPELLEVMNRGTTIQYKPNFYLPLSIQKWTENSSPKKSPQRNAVQLPASRSHQWNAPAQQSTAPQQHPASPPPTSNVEKLLEKMLDKMNSIEAKVNHLNDSQASMTASITQNKERSESNCSLK